MLGYWTILVFFTIVLWAAILRPMALWYLYAAALPFFGIIAEVGLQVTPILVVSVGMFIAIMLKGINHVMIPGVIMKYFFYATLITIVMSFNLPEEVSDYALFRGRLRWVAQIIVMLLFFMPVLFLYIKTPDIKKISIIISTFCGTVGVLCVLGILQLLVFKTTGKDIFPIDLFSPQDEMIASRSAFTAILKNEQVLRVSSCGAGEPKHFGYTCAIALTLYLLRLIYTERDYLKRIYVHMGMVALLIINIILTLSTQSFLILGINILLLFMIILFRRGLFSGLTLTYFFFLALGSIVIARNDYVNQVMQARIYERLEETGVVEDFNITIINFLKDNPLFLVTGTGLGQVHFFAQDYIPRNFRYYMRDSVFVAKAGSLRVISELGIIGFLLFVSIVFYLVYRLSLLRRISRHSLIAIVLTFIMLVNFDYLVSSDSPPYYIFSFVLGLTLLARRKELMQ